jgi:hypothetical protein
MLMKIRKLLRIDFSTIDQIWRKFYRGKFGLPTLKNVVSDRVVTLNGHVVAYGMLKGYVEAIMIIDQALSQRQKVEAFTSLLMTAEAEAKLAGIEQLQIFVQDPSFENILKDHFNFKPCSGVAMVKDIS